MKYMWVFILSCEIKLSELTSQKQKSQFKKLISKYLVKIWRGCAKLLNCEIVSLANH